MKITFHGAAGTVTGSKHLVTTNSGKKILLDCGMFQGHGKDNEVLNRNWGFEPSSIDCLVLSHAHIDHSGLIPKLVKEGFRGKIYATNATVDLTEILLYNSAQIQESDIAFLNKKRANLGKNSLELLYTLDDAKAAMPSFEKIPLGEQVAICENVKLCLYEVGHILGSSTVFLHVTEDGKTSRIAFSGDVGRYNDPILKSPVSFPQADYIIIESTYGDRLHDLTVTYTGALKKYIEGTCLAKGGKLIIPAFSVGRTQELLYALNELALKGELPPVDYFVDSPLSIQATEMVKEHTECFNKAVIKLMQKDPDPFSFKGLQYIEEVGDSKRLNDYQKPCVIISASGMADAGRVKHHIANSVGCKKNTVLLVGYCEPTSLGARLKLHPPEVTIFGESFKVKAEIEVIDSMSAHADYNDLCQYLACQDPAEVTQLFIVHGEPEVQEEFKRRLLKKGYRDVIIPRQHEQFTLERT